MVIFIGGYSCTGKTLLANRLMKATQVPYFSMDYLKMGIFRSDPKCGFTPLDDDAYIAKKLWPIIREMAYTYIENGQDMIIEGCYVRPEHIEDIDKVYEKDIKFIFLGFSEHYIQDHFVDGIIGHKDAIEGRSKEDERPIEEFLLSHSELIKSAKAYKQKDYMIDKDYDREFNIILEDIKNLLRS